MTIWCNSCRCHVSAPCASHHHHHHHQQQQQQQDAAEDPRSSFCRRFRSTKGASKARRDHINHEIRNMRALLPVGQEDQERLSYLHSMAAICAYIRKSVLFQGLPAGVTSHLPLPYEAFLQALHGFVLVVSAQGRLVYVSENVSEYLGLSMIDVLQGDTLYDMVERCDVDVVKSNLDQENNSSAERSFTCSMQTSKAFRLQSGGGCSMLVRGSFQSPPQSWPSSSSSSSNQTLFVALCTPTVDRLPSSDSHLCQSFDSVHGLDMTFTRLSDNVLYYLGYLAEEMTGRSWYGLVHPEDLSLSADSHRSLMGADEGFQVEMVLRLQCKDLSWTWVYVRANKDSKCPSVSCTNFIISETEARFLQKTISSDAFRSQGSSSNARCFKRQRTSDSQSEEPGAKARKESERDYAASSSSQGDGSPAPSGGSPALFTPPYSPASSSSPLQQEELSRDLLMDVHGYSDRLLSSPECSPSYYCYPEAGLTCHHSPSGAFLDAAAVAAEHAFEQAAFSSRSPLSSSSPAYDFPACTADARLVPDSLSVSDVCDGPVDCALHQDDFGFLERPQGGSLGQMHHVPTHSSLLTPGQSPTSTGESYSPYSERERAEISILAQQISSLASSFATYHHHGNRPLQTGATDVWPRHPPPPSALPLRGELVLDDGVFDSILKDLDMVPRKPLGVSPPPIAAEQFAVTDPFGLQLGRREHNTELHQLNRYMQSGPQQGGLAEENLY